MKTLPHTTADVDPPSQALAGDARAHIQAVKRYLRASRSSVVIISAVVLVALGQLAEDLADSQPMQMLSWPPFIRRWAVVALVLYALVISEVIIRTLQRSFTALRPVLSIDEEAFMAYRRRSTRPESRLEVLLVAMSAAVVVTLYLGLGADLPVTNDPVTDLPLYLPASSIGALAVLVGYTVVGWAGLRLVYLATRLGRILGQMSREPLRIDVFDTTSLLPFGNIALAVALAPAGMIVILLVGLGPPSSLLSWSVLVLASLAGVLALLLPLRGVHEQMSDAKDAALATVNARLSELYAEVSRTASTRAEDLVHVRDGTNTFVPLRKTISEMTTWPFRDTVAFGRAVLIATAPLIYTTLSELIKVLWIPIITR